MTLPQVRLLPEDDNEASLPKKAKTESWKLEAVLGKDIVDVVVKFEWKYTMLPFHRHAT